MKFLGVSPQLWENQSIVRRRSSILNPQSYAHWRQAPFPAPGLQSIKEIVWRGSRVVWRPDSFPGFRSQFYPKIQDIFAERRIWELRQSTALGGGDPTTTPPLNVQDAGHPIIRITYSWYMEFCWHVECDSLMAHLHSHNRPLSICCNQTFLWSDSSKDSGCSIQILSTLDPGSSTLKPMWSSVGVSSSFWPLPAIVHFSPRSRIFPKLSRQPCLEPQSFSHQHNDSALFEKIRYFSSQHCILQTMCYKDSAVNMNHTSVLSLET